jgi:predicted HTH transcriptional regulator
MTSFSGRCGGSATSKRIFAIHEQPGKRQACVPRVEPSLPEDLNPRQVLACEYVRGHGSIASKDLISLMDGSISKRTASYDIQDLVNRGLLVKIGRGPSTRYVRFSRGENV